MEPLDHLLVGRRGRLQAAGSGIWQAKLKILRDSLTVKQQGFYDDSARKIASLNPRGSGKTTVGRARFIKRMVTTKNARCLYVALSRPMAEKLIWLPLKQINDSLELGATFNESKLLMTLPHNGAMLQLVGADDEAEIDKQRGLPFHEVGIDEAASIKKKILNSFLDEIIGPRLGDYRGTVWMMGTPSDRGRHDDEHRFYQATRRGSTISRLYDERDLPEYKNWKRWSFHTWPLKDNDRAGHVDRGCKPGCRAAHLWEEALEQKEANGWTDDNPKWRREYLGQWAADDVGFVYRFRELTEDGDLFNVWVPGRDTGEPFGLPAGHDWRFVYGMDLGQKDPFAIVVLAFADTYPCILEAYEYTKAGLGLSQEAEILAGLLEQTGYPEGWVADTAGLGGKILEWFASEYGWVIKAAEKKNKPDHIEVLNGDLVDGRFKAIQGKELQAQMSELQWDDTGLREDKAQPNHVTDATVYARTEVQHHFTGAAPFPRPKRETQERDAQDLEESEAALDRDLERQRRGPDEDWFDEEFKDDFGGFA